MNEVTLKNGNVLSIRPAKAIDAKIILEYVEIIAGESDNITFGPGEFTMTVEQEVQFIENVAQTDNEIFIVGYIGDELVSIANVHSGKRPRVRHSGELGISVKKKYWRQGIGRAMMHYLIEWAKTGGILRKLNLRVRVDNHGAIALYRSLDFFEQGTITREFFVGDQFFSCLHMGLEID